jgi:dihydrofolate synthase/folylpolyglutamate synthase
MRNRSLSEWLMHLEQLHPSEIDLGLARVQKAAERLNISPIARKVITVAGTNGKGSTIALINQILTAAGYRVGCYTSPHIQSYNERVLIDGKLVSDEDLCTAFEQIDIARGDISLTYFEFGTLAALILFSQANLDVAILEVGLGGRLDAVNIVDPDISVLTTVSMDHQAWLGNTREKIGYEKAGIFRHNVPAVFGHVNVPRSVAAHADDISAPLICMGKDFGYEIIAKKVGQNSLSCWGLKQLQGNTNGIERVDKYKYDELVIPSLPVMNAATAIQAVHLSGLTINKSAINKGLQVCLAGRYQEISRGYRIILDVAHNPEAATYLHNKLSKELVKGKVHALLGVLADKESGKIIKELAPVIDSWAVAKLETSRSQNVETIQQQVLFETGKQADGYDSVAEAFSGIDSRLANDDLLVVFGSFYTVNAALDWLDTQTQEL